MHRRIATRTLSQRDLVVWSVVSRPLDMPRAATNDAGRWKFRDALLLAAQGRRLGVRSEMAAKFLLAAPARPRNRAARERAC